MRGAVIASVLLIAGCGQSRALTVDVRTDFVPGVEFVDVRTTVAAASSDHVAFVGEDYGSGRRVAELVDVHATDTLLTVALLDARGVAIASRPVALHLDASYALTVVITRSCRGVHCPGATDPMNATSCLGGLCVDPDCVALGDPMCMTAQCHAAGDCHAGAACSTAQCTSGSCIYAPGTSCGAGTYCDPMLGCQPLPATPDAGPPDAGALDAGPPPDGAGPPDASAPTDLGTDAGPTCGGAGMPCCGGATCTGALTCVSGSCVTACAAVSGDPCCAGDTCASGFVCETGAPVHRCSPCGGPGQELCTTGTPCQAGLTAGSRCMYGGMAGVGPGYDCSPIGSDCGGGICVPGGSPGVCWACGYYDYVCCRMSTCGSGYTCNGSNLCR